MRELTIRFLPGDRTIRVIDDEEVTLSEAARHAGVYVGGLCGGEGVCGKCRVVIQEGIAESKPTGLLTREELARGYRLACATVARSDLVVEIPPESRLGKDGERYRDFSGEPGERAAAEIAPLVEKIALQLAEPTLDDATADEERLLGAVRKTRAGPIIAGLEVARALPRTLRSLDASKSAWKWEWDGSVTAAVASRAGADGDVSEVLFVERGDTSGTNLGLALDIGTTTVVAHLVDLTTGETREAAAKYNSQTAYGADVIGRINHARSPDGAKELHGAVVGDVETLIDEVVTRAGVAREDVTCAVASGNTTMLHFLLGLEADLIRLSPFAPAATSPGPFRAREVGIRIHPRGMLYAQASVGSYVGGDITSGVLASRMYESEELALFLDIGTNGEVVLGSKEFLVACSASAGPAFEGGSVKCGMRATSGAIDTVHVSRDDLRVEATTIDGAPPVGLCGTGLVDAVAEMLVAGLVDRSGALQVERAPERFADSDEDGRPEFTLVSAKESGGPRDIVISTADIENIIRTKGAIYAAADSLVQSLGLSFADIQKVYIAGAFGNKLDVGNCMTIGLLPDVPVERVEFIGNSSVAGSKLVMTNRAELERALSLRASITYQELMVDAGYMEKFTSACFLPHTDLSRFPSVERKLAEGNG